MYRNVVWFRVFWCPLLLVLYIGFGQRVPRWWPCLSTCSRPPMAAIYMGHFLLSICLFMLSIDRAQSTPLGNNGPGSASRQQAGGESRSHRSHQRRNARTRVTSHFLPAPSMHMLTHSFMAFYSRSREGGSEQRRKDRVEAVSRYTVTLTTGVTVYTRHNIAARFRPRSVSYTAR